MSDSETVSCRYLFEGKCIGVSELELLRGENCKNDVKETCCYLCKYKNRATCEIRCDFLEARERKDTRVQSLPIDEVKVGYAVLLRTYRVFGIVLLVSGFIFLVVFEALSEVSYLKALEFQWRLYALTKSPKLFIEFLFGLIPIYLILLGVLLIFYSVVKWRNTQG